MVDERIKVVSINTADRGGGAERIAWTLFQGLQARGCDSWLAVGDRKSDDPRVCAFLSSPRIDCRRHRIHHWLDRPIKWVSSQLGIEDFQFPHSRLLRTLTGSPPHVIHCHNLHGGYFDLRMLAKWSRHVPVFVTLHDQWWITGHCASPLGCLRWQTGCGHCPHLDTPPAVKRDATRFNWKRKQAIYQRCRLHVAGPTKWMCERINGSILATGIAECRVIPHGINLSVFRPGSQDSARRELGISPEMDVIVFVANQGKSNPFKDYPTLSAAVATVARQPRQRELVFCCIGEASPEERRGKVRFWHIPYQSPDRLAQYYQAADLYLHAGKGGTFGLVIAEAMACGTPVVTTRIGGVPEVCRHGEHGLLVQPGEPATMARAVQELLDNPPLRKRMGEQAALSARGRFNQDNMIDAYLAWYREVLARRRGARETKSRLLTGPAR